MSSEELEYATLQWERTEKQWMTKTSPPRRRVFTSPCGSQTIFHLMLAYDLDVPDGRPRTIIESGLKTDKGGIIVSDYPESRPLASFVMSVIFYDDRARFAGCSNFEVGNLNDDCLTATLLHSFDFPSPIHLPKFSLRGTRLAWFKSSGIEIYDWKQSSSPGYYKASFQLDRSPSHVQLLPENRVLCLYNDSLTIYALPRFCFVEEDGGTPPSKAQTLHSLPFPGPVTSLTSPSYSSLRVERDGTCVMLVNPDEAIYKLTIPLHSKPTLKSITSDFHTYLRSATLIFYRNHAEPMYKEVHRLTFRRGTVKDCDEPGLPNTLDFYHNRARYPFPVLDDISCRSVLAMAREDEFHVFDHVVLS
ncbi:hypothetical protein ONZ45_g2938 [Pleurotus djamor]|nr:hypothetical protein ONZ45_g2938 [Pleurotus djamor]